MYVESQPCLCRVCHAHFNLEVLQDVLIKVWAAQIKSLHCPKCGAGWKKLSFVSDELAQRMMLAEAAIHE